MHLASQHTYMHPASQQHPHLATQHTYMHPASQQHQNLCIYLPSIHICTQLHNNIKIYAFIYPAYIYAPSFTTTSKSMHLSTQHTYMHPASQQHHNLCIYLPSIHICTQLHNNIIIYAFIYPAYIYAPSFTTISASSYPAYIHNNILIYVSCYPVYICAPSYTAYMYAHRFTRTFKSKHLDSQHIYICTQLHTNIWIYASSQHTCIQLHNNIWIDAVSYSA